MTEDKRGRRSSGPVVVGFWINWVLVQLVHISAYALTFELIETWIHAFQGIAMTLCLLLFVPNSFLLGRSYKKHSDEMSLKILSVAFLVSFVSAIFTYIHMMNTWEGSLTISPRGDGTYVQMARGLIIGESSYHDYVMANMQIIRLMAASTSLCSLIPAMMVVAGKWAKKAGFPGLIKS